MESPENDGFLSDFVGQGNNAIVALNSVRKPCP
jgi:hypothetical protein